MSGRRRRLVAIDLDGTLLDGAGYVSERSRSALRAVADRGHAVVLATGRPPQLVAHLADPLGTTVTHVVGTNGTMIATFPDGQLLQLLGFPAELARRTVRRLRAHDEELGFALATESGFAHERGFAERMPAPVGTEPVDDVLGLAGSTAYKLMAFHHRRSAHQLIDHLSAVLGEELVVRHLGADAVEIGPGTVDKGSGLAWLCAHLGVEAVDVVAFGDEWNDITMLQWAGRGVAMANADEMVRAAADEVTAANIDDGVAVVLERLLLDGEL